MMGIFKFIPLCALIGILAGCGGGGGGGATPATPGTPLPATDTTAPTVSITAPAASAGVHGVTAVTASASDNVAVTKVEFYLNGSLAASSTSSPYLFNWDTSSLARGSYTLSAKAYDAAGNVGDAIAVPVTVPIAAALSTVVGGTSAVGTVSLTGLTTPAAFGVDVVVSLPAGATIASAIPSGVAANALAPVLHSDGVTLSMASGTGFGSGEVMRITFANVPAGASAADFQVTLSALFDSGGAQIQ